MVGRFGTFWRKTAVTGKVVAAVEGFDAGEGEVRETLAVFNEICNTLSRYLCQQLSH